MYNVNVRSSTTLESEMSYNDQFPDPTDIEEMRVNAVGRPGSPERGIYDRAMEALDEAESVLADLGPAEYVWLMTQVVMACTRRIANRTGAV